MIAFLRYLRLCASHYPNSKLMSLRPQIAAQDLFCACLRGCVIVAAWSLAITLIILPAALFLWNALVSVSFLF
ncbi:hypothetical protein J7376_08495 [Paracoccus sp. R12_1]|uniref:hypothetical protein n=1 Tax=unclassified Paracoccus (in: a-proteobacteria) TaxID=2688777 RepID=UPI001ADC207C|nr:hypothetical protein [Paracoccus sp. R12_1]MBO9456033.1 hypothetical protein [Paracoccus sp. R12_2]MBO9486551.1 hypothetical protein [Paracoccus sp. R12_1]